MHERLQDIEHTALDKIAMLETELIQTRRMQKESRRGSVDLTKSGTTSWTRIEKQTVYVWKQNSRVGKCNQSTEGIF